MFNRPHSKKFLSTLSLRRATKPKALKSRLCVISIHALLAESDGNAHSNTSFIQVISIHALLAESDAAPPAPQGKSSKFLSTLSLRRATLNGSSPLTSWTNFYPRSPCGERHARRALGFVDPDISIHALLAESDPGCVFFLCDVSLFLSTLSLRRATRTVSSLHSNSVYFYPRSPCGERRITEGSICFDSSISIHALLAESDAETAKTSNADTKFLSTLSLRRAT